MRNLTALLPQRPQLQWIVFFPQPFHIHVRSSRSVWDLLESVCPLEMTNWPLITSVHKIDLSMQRSFSRLSPVHVQLYQSLLLSKGTKLALRTQDVPVHRLCATLSRYIYPCSLCIRRLSQNLVSLHGCNAALCDEGLWESDMIRPSLH